MWGLTQYERKVKVRSRPLASGGVLILQMAVKINGPTFVEDYPKIIIIK